MPAMATWVVLPVKILTEAKQRLSPGIGTLERYQLCRAMVEDVLEAISQSQLHERILVVTEDSEITQLAERYRARIMAVAERGHSVVAARAIAELSGGPGSTVVLLPGDVPAITTEEIDTLVAEHWARAAAGPAVTIVPDREGTGTNALVLTPPDSIAPAFGPDSFARHCASARIRGIEPMAARPKGICHDVDTVDDLERCMGLALGRCTRGYLEESGLGRRIGRNVHGV
jgi:2-phospho-L-lactate guanylyltransferase